MTILISATNWCLEMRLAEDASGMLCLQTWPSGVPVYSFENMRSEGWGVVESTVEERALLDSHGVLMPPV